MEGWKHTAFSDSDIVNTNQDFEQNETQNQRAYTAEAVNPEPNNVRLTIMHDLVGDMATWLTPGDKVGPSWLAYGDSLIHGIRGYG